MRESCTYGVVRGALSNERPYRDHHCPGRGASASDPEILRRYYNSAERIDPWIRMRRFLARFSKPETFVHTPSSADFITTTSGFRFSVHTGPQNLCP